MLDLAREAASSAEFKAAMEKLKTKGAAQVAAIRRDTQKRVEALKTRMVSEVCTHGRTVSD